MGGTDFADPNKNVIPPMVSHIPLRKKIIAIVFKDFAAVMVLLLSFMN
jgi:hypothetical protein